MRVDKSLPRKLFDTNNEARSLDIHVSVDKQTKKHVTKPPRNGRHTMSSSSLGKSSLLSIINFSLSLFVHYVTHFQTCYIVGPTRVRLRFGLDHTEPLTIEVLIVNSDYYEKRN